MKKILLATAFALTVSFANAQLKYGLKAGVNFANMDISSQGMSISPKSQTSFHLTGFVDVAISEKFSFQPGLSFQGKGYKVDV
ncbi:outer membrane beta-barrel protein, partial [Pseudopedobacter sp.]|uniref:outer membrane beta-barrel protein n=1 Tax=Pseudopedobacter sp. TaxID=1936787 RepID=UPI003341A101